MSGGISAIKGFDYQKEELAVSGLPDTQLASAKLLVIKDRFVDGRSPGRHRKAP
jgi:hypothetical protein